MNGKVLLNIYSLQVRNDVLNILVQHEYDFLEVFSEYELKFKYNLMKEKLDIYIHELDEGNYEESLEQIRQIDSRHIKVIVMIHEYSSRIIHDTLALKVRDIIVLPIERDHLTKKILSLANVEKAVNYMPEIPPNKEVYINKQEIESEINRAVRGEYSLSFVIIKYDGIEKEVCKVFGKKLATILRTTDRLVKYDENKLLALCPFTSKVFLVEVENKIRQAYSSLSKNKENSMYLYGVTFPVDGKDADMLLKKLLDGLHDSAIVSNIEGTLYQMTKEKLKLKLRRDYQ